MQEYGAQKNNNNNKKTEWQAISYYHALNGMEIKEATLQITIFQEIVLLTNNTKSPCVCGIAQWNKEFILEC